MAFVSLFEDLFPAKSVFEYYNTVIAGILVCPDSSSYSKTPIIHQESVRNGALPNNNSFLAQE
jgi:hypothetical protein